MYSVLNKCVETKSVVSLYSNLDNAFVHLTGYVLKVTQEYVLIAHITEHGCYDGYIVKHTDDIYRIDYDGTYEKKIASLYHLREQKHNLFTILNVKMDMELNLLLLDCAKQTHKVISVEYEDAVLSGFVEGYDSDKLLISIVDENGVQNGHSIINLNTIQTIALDTDTEQDILLLYQANLQD